MWAMALRCSGPGSERNSSAVRDRRNARKYSRSAQQRPTHYRSRSRTCIPTRSSSSRTTKAQPAGSRSRCRQGGFRRLCGLPVRLRRSAGELSSTTSPRARSVAALQGARGRPAVRQAVSGHLSLSRMDRHEDRSPKSTPATCAPSKARSRAGNPDGPSARRTAS